MTEKLIRDLVPAFAAARGDTLRTRNVSSKKEYLDFLLMKLREETMELVRAPGDQEENGDIREVLYTIAGIYDITPERFDAIPGRVISHRDDIESGREWQELLRRELEDRVTMFIDNPEIECIPDILHVLNEWAELHGHTPGQVEAIRLEKRGERGGFDKGLVLQLANQFT